MTRDSRIQLGIPGRVNKAEIVVSNAIHSDILANVAFNGHRGDLPRGYALVENRHDLMLGAFGTRTQLIGD